MKKTILAVLFLFTFLSVNFLQAQAPENIPALPTGPEIENAADVYGNEVIMRADQMVDAKDQNGALAFLAENLDRFTRLRANVFGKMMDMLLAQDNAMAARELLRQHAIDQELARAGVNQVYAYYIQKQDNAALTEWTGQLMDLPLPDDLKSQACAWHMNAVCAHGVTDAAQPLVRNYIDKFSTETCRSIFSPTVVMFIGNGKYDDANRLLDMIEKACPVGKGAETLRSMVFTERARMKYLQGRWNDGEAYVMKKASDLSDDDLAGILSFSAAKANKDDELEAVDRLGMFIINNQKDKNKARNEAAACGLNILKISKKPDAIPARFEQLLSAGINPFNLYMLYSDYFYFVILPDNAKLAKQMLAIGDKLYDKLDRPHDKKLMALLLLDSAFITGDYQRCLQIIDANSKYWEEEWEDSAKIKIRAHLALQNKNYKEAVDGFRKYMDYVAKNNVSTRDPVCDQVYTSEMLLGMNALRIGDILRNNLNDEPGALENYAEAEKYFRKALSATKPDSREAKYINGQMSQIASRMKK